LKLIRTRLTDLPALIIDDESDQAGLNTVDPRRSVNQTKERSKTNQRIVELPQPRTAFGLPRRGGGTVGHGSSACLDPPSSARAQQAKQPRLPIRQQTRWCLWPIFIAPPNGIDESFTAQMIVSSQDLAPDIAGVQNVWIQGVGCGTAVVNFNR
jgi:hypothetical protein